MKTAKHMGSRFDDLLQEDGLLAEVEALAVKRVLAFQKADSFSRGLMAAQGNRRGLVDPAGGSHENDPDHRTGQG